MKAKLLLSFLGAALISAVIVPSVSVAAEYYYAGARVGSSGHRLAIAFARIADRFVDGVSITVEETGGGVTNLTMVNEGKADFGQGPADVANEAYTGTGRFEGNPQTNLRSWMVGYERREHMVVLADSPIKTWQDLKGHNVSVAAKGSGSNLTCERILKVLGIWDSINPFFISYKDATNALQLGNVDASYFGTGIPVSSLVELGISHPFRILPVTDADAKRISDAYPAYRVGIIPKGTYEGIDEDVQTISVFNLSWVNKNVPDDVVYRLTKAVWEHNDIMIQAHASQKEKDLSMVKRSLVPALPLHPGAERYYREVGAIE